MSLDLLSLVVVLSNPNPVSMAYDQGRALAAELLARIEMINPALSKQLHAQKNGPKPYTVSNLIDLPNPQRFMVFIPSRSETWFRITSFSPELTGFLVKQLVPTLTGEIKLGEATFEIERCISDPTAHEWAGAANYDDLVEKYMIENVPRKIGHYFASPTSFHSNGNHVPYILPAMALRSWVKAWNKSAPVEFPTNQFAEVDRLVAVNYYRMQTMPVRYGKTTIIGGIGNCTFNVISKDPYWQHLANLLSAFAFYCGTGVKTAFGMGQTRRLWDSFYRGL